MLIVVLFWREKRQNSRSKYALAEIYLWVYRRITWKLVHLPAVHLRSATRKKRVVSRCVATPTQHKGAAAAREGLGDRHAGPMPENQRKPTLISDTCARAFAFAGKHPLWRNSSIWVGVQGVSEIRRMYSWKYGVVSFFFACTDII